MELILVRHALPERVDIPDGDIPGGDIPGGVAVDRRPADPGLTETGERQAARLVDALRATDVAGLYTSPQRRALGTAAPLAAALGRDPAPVADLREYDADAGHYVPVHEMPRLDPRGWERMLAGLLPAYVDTAEFTARVYDACERLVEAHPGRQSVVVVTHAGVINTYLARLLGIDRPLAFPLDYAGLTRVIAGRDGRRAVRTVNEIAHVEDLLAVH